MKKFFFFLIGIFLFLIVFSAFMTVLIKETSLVGRVALVRIEGPIIDSKSVVDEIRGYIKDTSIKAIVLRINSAGGGVAPSQEIHAEVKRAAAIKKVVVSMGSVAASGGYYIAAPATKIVANPGTVTGSIGVIMEIPNLKELMDKLGIKTEVIKSGKHKDIASVFRGIGKEEREILQSLLDDVHDQFIKDVAVCRNLSPDKIRRIADARLFSGRQALEIGLVDELGDLQHAIKLAATLAGIEGEPEVVVKKKKPPLLELIEGNIFEIIMRSIPIFELKYEYKPLGGF
ncbi:MAG: signal peptide peptidase SppA [Thermodesulfovibrionales bacterium]|nr:signal peptide peptidase SppA [Thermodesulfovibrionales bacterium]